MSSIDNKERSASWEKIAKEFQAERDALQKNLFRIQKERDDLIDELKWLKHLQEINDGC